MSQAITRYPTHLPFPFSRAVEAGGFLFLSGQVAMDPDGTPRRGDVKAQTTTILDNIDATLKSVGSSLEDVVKVTVWLSDMEHFAQFNEAYSPFFPKGYPVRSVVSAKLAFGLDVEIEVQALAPVRHCIQRSQITPGIHHGLAHPYPSN